MRGIFRFSGWAWLVLFLSTCSLDHSNPYDPNAPLSSPNKISFAYADNIGSIGSTSIELKWSRSTESDFGFYVVARSKSALGLSNLVLSSEQKEKVVNELKTNKESDFWNWTPEIAAVRAPTFNSLFKPVSVRPDANANVYEDQGLSKSTKYYYALLSFKKNFTSFSVSAEFAIETTPDLVAARNSDLLVYFRDQPTAINEVDIDPQTGEIYISGYCWGSSKAMTNAASYSFDYFLAMVDTNSAFSSLGYMWEAHMMLLSQHTNTWSDFRKLNGFAVHTNYKVIIPELVYPDWTIWRVSNLASALAAPPDNRLKYTSGTGLGSIGSGIIDDYTTRMYMDKANNKLYLAGDDIDVVTVGATTFTYLTTYDYSGVRLRLNGISMDGSGNLIVSDVEKNVIYKVSSSGSFSYLCGSSGTKYGQFLDVSDTEVDSLGNIYVADTANHRVQKFDSSGKFLSSYNLREKVGSQFESPRGLKYFNKMLYVGCAKAVIEIPVD